ncbi:MAG: DUF3987 domain-containing protein, partial [Pseudomonadota bacterium]
MESALSGCAEAVVYALLGEPNRTLSRPRQLRYGTNGSLSVDLDKATWFDHEHNTGGGLLALVRRERGGTATEARRWLQEQGVALESEVPAAPRPRIVATYDYCGEDGHLLFQVLRTAPKSFRQRQPDGRGGWDWSVKGAQKVLYRLPELLAAPPEAPVFIVEGEKDADRLASLGLIATANAGGAGKWQAGYAKTLAGRRVTVLPDNDSAGRAHAEAVKQSLTGEARAVAVLDLDGLPEKGDVSDWLDAGGTPERLLTLAEAALAEDAPDTPAPIPLHQARRKPEPVPFAALGPLRAAVEAVATQTQAPDALALQSVLAAASLATQALADVETLGGQAPVSLYCLSIATSGERKSGCDKLALAPVREAEQSRRRAHRNALAEHQDKADLHEHRRKAILRQNGDADEQKADLAALGPPPTPPLAPDLLFSDPTIEGLCRHFEHGQPSVGV